LDNLYIALNGIHKEMVSQESGYQCLGGEPGFMMSRDAEADDMNWQTNTWMKAAYLGWQCNMNETNGYNYGIKEQMDTITNRYNKWLYLFHISSC
jgi:hypothetical protein